MILCISSNEEQLFESGVLLRNAGYQSFLCADAADALRFLPNSEVDVIVSDESLGTEGGQCVINKPGTFILVSPFQRATQPC
jgi:DNA-binding NtrC family response regulator